MIVPFGNKNRNAAIEPLYSPKFTQPVHNSNDNNSNNNNNDDDVPVGL